MRFPTLFTRKPSFPATTTPRFSSPGGRRYLSGVTYVLPKDLPEAKRLDFQHHLLHAVLHGDTAAPLDETVDFILDVATGTGRWPIEIARRFPQAQVIGLDMDLPEPPVPALPANYHFVQGNLFAGLPFADASFAYVHQRFLVLALPAKQWPFVVGELVRVTRPGRYVEVVEGGGAFSQIGPATKQLQAWWNSASQSQGIDVSLMAHLPAFLQQAGLSSIVSQTHRVPVGAWGGRVGEMLKQDILASLPALKEFICRAAHLAPEQFDATCAALSDEYEHCHTTYEYYVAYGQKGSERSRSIS